MIDCSVFDQVEEDRYTGSIEDGFVEVFLAFSAIAAFSIGISVVVFGRAESNTAELHFDGTTDASQTADEAGPRNLLVVSQRSLKNGYLLSIFH